jgi:hypothetical protein
MANSKKYKYIEIRQNQDGIDESGSIGEQFEGKPVYRIYNIMGSVQIGIISWYKPWKQYVFSSREGCVFNNSCLRDVLDFMENNTGKESANGS